MHTAQRKCDGEELFQGEWLRQDVLAGGLQPPSLLPQWQSLRGNPHRGVLRPLLLLICPLMFRLLDMHPWISEHFQISRVALNG